MTDHILNLCAFQYSVLILLAMKSTFLFLLALVALARAETTDNCSEDILPERLYNCVRNGLLSILANTREESCMQLRQSASCLETTADECIDDEFRSLVDVELNRMNDMIDNLCSYKALSKLRNPECRPSRLDERMNNCLFGALRLLRMEETSEEQVCSELKSSENCLRSLADECLSERQAVIVEEQFRRLNTRMRPFCADTDSPDDDVDVDACINVHKDYIHGCLRENQMKAISHFMVLPRPNRNVMMCTLYNWISECVIERVDTKCGVVAGNKVRLDLNNPTQEIRDACEEAEMDYRH